MAKTEVEGGKKLAAKLKDIQKTATNAVEQALLVGALRVERDAKVNAPVDMGRLRSSITHRLVDAGSNNPYAEVGTNVTYAKYQEFGTGERGKESGVTTPADYEYGNSKGIPAQPFLFPAYNSNKSKILKDIAKAFKKGVGL